MPKNNPYQFDLDLTNVGKGPSIVDVGNGFTLGDVDDGFVYVPGLQRITRFGIRPEQGTRPEPGGIGIGIVIVIPTAPEPGTGVPRVKPSP